MLKSITVLFILCIIRYFLTFHTFSFSQLFSQNQLNHVMFIKRAHFVTRLTYFHRVWLKYNFIEMCILCLNSISYCSSLWAIFNKQNYIIWLFKKRRKSWFVLYIGIKKYIDVNVSLCAQKWQLAYNLLLFTEQLDNFVMGILIPINFALSRHNLEFFTYHCKCLQVSCYRVRQMGISDRKNAHYWQKNCGNIQ